MSVLTARPLEKQMRCSLFGFLSSGARQEQRSKVITTGKYDSGMKELSKELPKFLNTLDD